MGSNFPIKIFFNDLVPSRSAFHRLLVREGNHGLGPFPVNAKGRIGKHVVKPFSHQIADSETIAEFDVAGFWRKTRRCNGVNWPRIYPSFRNNEQNILKPALLEHDFTIETPETTYILN